MAKPRERLAQRREAAGFSQQSLADVLQVDRTTVGRWEQGGGPPRPSTRPKLARALQVTLNELELLLAGPELPSGASGTATARNQLSHGVATFVGADSKHEGDDMERRAFLAGLIGTGVGPSAPAMRVTRLLKTDGHDDLERLQRGVDRIVRLEQRSQYAALTAVLPGVIAAVETAIGEASGGAQRHVARQLGTAKMVAAFVLIKHDAPDDAKTAATEALRLAQGADDQVLVTAVLRCLAEAHLRADDFALATDLAIEAAAHLARAGLNEPEAVAVQGAGLLTAATACARSGDRVEATRLLLEAQRSADQISSDHIGTVVFGPTNLAIHRVAFEVELGDPRTALRHARQFRPEIGRGMEERRARYLIDVARAHVLMGQDDEAVKALLAGEAISAEEIRTHRHSRAAITELLHRERRGATPALRPLAARCRLLGAV